MHQRWTHKLGPVAIGANLGLAASTVHAVLVRCELSRLAHVDPITGEPVAATNTPTPGRCCTSTSRRSATSRTAEAGVLGRQQGEKNSRRTVARTGKRGYAGGVAVGTAYVHTVIDDHSRVAYAEVHDDETAATAIGVLRRAVAWFAARGVRTERVLFDNGSAYKSHAWRDACAQLNIKHKRTLGCPACHGPPAE